jgi:hypothetical protein
MAVIANQRGTILQVVQEVMRRLNYDPPASLSANRTTLKCVSFINDVVAHISDYGDWPAEFQEVALTAAACAVNLEINVSAPIKRIYEIHENSNRSPLLQRDIQDIRLLQRGSAVGAPRQFALTRTSGINPIVRFDRRQTTTAMGFNVAVYTSPLVYATSDGSKVPPWSSRLLVQGTYAAMMLDENDGVPSNHYQANFAMFQNQLKEEHNRMSSDTGTDVYLTIRR